MIRKHDPATIEYNAQFKCNFVSENFKEKNLKADSFDRQLDAFPPTKMYIIESTNKIRSLSSPQ